MEAQQIGQYFTIAWLAIITMAAAIFTFHLYYNSRLRQLEKENQIKSFKAVIDAEEEQKRRIAMNLHDQVITILTAAGQNIQDQLLEYENERLIPKSLDNASNLVNQGISDIRAIALELIPKTFSEQGLIKAIELYISQINVFEQAETELVDNTLFKNSIPIPVSDQLTVYRICQEIINNLLKHAKYTYLKVTVDYLNNNLIFKFEHDGDGISNEKIEAFRKSEKGLGLESLKTRLFIIEAKMDYLNDVIILSVPVK